MRNLLSAEFHRLRCNPINWILIAAAVLSGVIYGISAFDSAFDDMFVVTLFVIQAILISLSIGREYTDGTIRNKIIAGKTKAVIFLSKLIMSIAVSVIMVIAFLIPLVVILSFSVLSKIPNQILMWTLLGFFLLNIVWAVVFTFVSSLISSKGVGGMINLVLIIAVMFAAYRLESITGQPEFILMEEASEVSMSPEEVEQVLNDTYQGSYATNVDENGAVTYSKYVITGEEKQPNPRYVKDPMNRILRGIDAALPYGQVIEYVSCLTTYCYGVTEDYSRIKTFPLYSLLLIAVLSGAGTILFMKKEIN
jgi:ABC-type transport system involved in multi-copper enzyme maturation permease subunit